MIVLMGTMYCTTTEYYNYNSEDRRRYYTKTLGTGKGRAIKEQKRNIYGNDYCQCIENSKI